MTDKADNRQGSIVGQRFRGIRRSRPLVMVLFLAVVFGYGFSSCWEAEETPAENTNESADMPANDALPANLTNALAEAEEDDGGAYATFRHGLDYHSRLPCLACHTRESNASRISFPGKVDHSPCAGCHTLQFRNNKSSICTICHTDAEAGTLKSFPGLRSFGARFDHNKHRRTNCGTCHRPQGKTLSIPKGSAAHTTCFACHSANSNNAMASCGTCHQPGAGRFMNPGGSKAFRANFSHAKHSRAQNLNCASCHTVLARGGRGKQVTAPVTAMHFATKGGTSCATCHNDVKAFGGEDFANCKRCHTGNSFGF